jgi:hypothetical protein
VLALSIDLSAAFNQQLGHLNAARQRALSRIPECCVATVSVFCTFANKVDVYPRFEFLGNSHNIPHPRCEVDWRKVAGFNSSQEASSVSSTPKTSSEIANRCQ